MAGRMTLRHLEIFAAVCDAGGVSAAARELGVSQPSVSQAVRDLEGHFGVALLDRSGRRARLTEQGRELRVRARDVLGSLDELERAMGEGGASTLRLASSITCATCHAPAILAILAETAPEVRVTVRVEDSRAVERDVVSGAADVGLIEGLVHDGSLAATPFARDRLVCVAPPGRAGDRLTAERLVGERLLLRERGIGVRELLEAALTERRLSCEPVWESVSTEALLAAVEAGIGLSVLPDALVKRAVGEGRVVRADVVDLSLTRELLVIRRRGRPMTAGMTAFLDALGVASA